jgi:hypothetical protein
MADGAQIVRGVKAAAKLNEVFRRPLPRARRPSPVSWPKSAPEWAPDAAVRARALELSRSQPFDRLPGGAVTAEPNLD